jgi:hypothetical protein
VFHLVWCVLLIVLILLMFSLVMMQGLKGHVEKATDDSRESISMQFNTVATAMISLFMATTGGTDWQSQYNVVGEAGPAFKIVYLFYIAFFTIVAWNTVLGSFVEKACRLALPDLEATAMEKHQEQQLYSKELSSMLLRKIDVDGDGSITLEEFRQQLQDHEVVAFFLARDINVTDAEMFFHMLSSIHGTDKVEIKTFTKAILRLRGNASALDMQAFHFDMKCLTQELVDMQQSLADMHAAGKLEILEMHAASHAMICSLHQHVKGSQTTSEEPPSPDKLSRLEGMMARLLNSKLEPQNEPKLVQATQNWGQFEAKWSPRPRTLPAHLSESPIGHLRL